MSAPLLSEILEQKEGVIPTEELKEIQEYAKALTSASKPLNDEEKEWVADYIATIGLALEADIEANRKVKERADKHKKTTENEATTSKKSTNPQPSTSKSFPNESQNIYEEIDTPKRTQETSAIKLNELAIKPEKFDGQKTMARRWLEDYEAASKANGWNETIMVKYFSTFLIKASRDWFTAIAQPKLTANTPWVTLRQMFIRYYIGPEEKGAVKMELEKTRQKYNEPATEFIARTMRLINIAEPNNDEADNVRKLKFKLQSHYQDKIIGQKPTTIEELNDLCREIEDRLEINKIRNNNSFKRFDGNKEKSKKSQFPRRPKNANPTKKKGFVKTRGEEKKDLDARGKLFCTHCEKEGHTEMYCWAKKNQTKKVAVSKEQRHSNQDDESPPEVNIIKSVCSVVASSAEGLTDCITHPIQLNGVEILAMIDTGSKLSIIREDVANKLNLEIDKTTINLVGADGNKLNCLGTSQVTISVKIGQTTKIIKIKVAVIQKLCVEILLGHQALAWLAIIVSPAGKCIRFEEEKSGIRTITAVSIPPRSQRVLTVRVDSHTQVGSLVLTKPLTLGSSLLMANSISKVAPDRTVEIMAANLDTAIMEIAPLTQLACFETIEPNYKVNTVCQLPKGNETYNVGDNLSSDQLKEINELIKNNSDVFSINGELGKTNLRLSRKSYGEGQFAIKSKRKDKSKTC